MILVYLLSFHLSYSRATRVFHSFPTRRSSDLDPRRCRTTTWRPRSAACSGGVSSTSASTSKRSGRRPRDYRSWLSMRSLPPRSEEHTSELQSLAYLVCRLLLEKKKEKNITIMS